MTRVFQIAKEYSRSPEAIIKLLRKHGIEVASHTSKLDEHALHTLHSTLGTYKVTVVDGDTESNTVHEDEEKDSLQKKKSAKKKKKVEEEKPKMAIRVIKRHKEDEVEEETSEQPKKLKKRLKRRGRSNLIQEQISKRTEQTKPEEAAAAPAPEVQAEAAPEAAPAAPKAEAPKVKVVAPKAKPAPEAEAKPAEAPVAEKKAEEPKAEAPAQEAKPAEAPAKPEAAEAKPAEAKKPEADAPAPKAEAPAEAPKAPADKPKRPIIRQIRSAADRPELRNRRPGGGAGGDRPRGDRNYSSGDRPRGNSSYSSNQRPPQGGGYQGGGQGGRPGGDRGGYSGGGRGYGGGDRPGGGPRQGGGGRPAGYNGPRQGGPGGPRQGGPGGPRPGGFGGPRPGGGGGRPGGGRPGGGRPGGFGGGPPSGGGGFGGGSPVEKASRARFGNQKPGGKKKKKGRRTKNVEHMEKIKMVTTSKVELPNEDLGIIMLSEGVTVKELAEKVNRKAKDVIKRMFEKGMMATLNDVLEDDLAIEIAKDFGYLAEIVSFEEDLQLQEEEGMDDEKDTSGVEETRAPIVTIMGHVDHGKTTLLDTIRKTKVADAEAGGITQHIGAYAVEHNEKKIVFLDTPGHEAFTKMRARGASVTDIVILVVAADDGVKPQTIEAINHAKAAKVPIITCVNKIDKPEANPERVKQMLTEHELVVEEYGGDSPCVEVSAKKAMGIEDLLEMILLVSDLNEYKASPGRRARGTVIEAQLDRGRGPVATVVVQDGTLKVGQHFFSGSTHGKIRAMHDDLGNNLEEAGPATPVEILGIQEVPSAGDTFQVTSDEVTARKIASFRKEKAREDQLRRQHTSLDQLFSNLKPSDIKDLVLIIKADVQGSLEGMIFALNKIQSEKVNLRIVHQGVGNITDNDVLLATASDGIIIGFNVKSERSAQDLADKEGIEIRNYSIIYEVVQDVEKAMLGLVAPTMEEREIGKASVKQIFAVAKLGKVAGCVVEDGKVVRDAIVRVFRHSEQIHEGKLQTLKRFRDDVNEVKSGMECGIGIQDYDDLEEMDEMRFFVMEEVEATEL